MRLVAQLIPILALVAACGDSGDTASPGTAMAEDTSAGDVSVCSCANDPITTGARAKACSELMASMSPEEAATATMACREQMAPPEKGIDLCFCVKTISTDPDILQACEKLIPKNFSAAQMTEVVAECARTGS